MQKKYQATLFQVGAAMVIVASFFIINNKIGNVDAARKYEVVSADPQDLAIANNWQLLNKNTYAAIASGEQSDKEKNVEVQVSRENGLSFTTKIADGSSVDIVEGSSDKAMYVGAGRGVVISSFVENKEDSENIKNDKMHKRIEEVGAAQVIVQLKLSDKLFYRNNDNDGDRVRKSQDFKQAKGELKKQIKGMAKFKRDLPIINAVVVDVDEKSLADIEQSNLVENVELDDVSHVTLDTSVAQIHANDVWPLFDNNSLPLTGAGQRIAVIDTGVDYAHPDLGGCIGGSCKVIGGYDFVNDDYDPADDNGHGTHVAATAAGNGLLKGVAPGAQILAYKVCSSSGSCFNSDIIAALNAAVDPNGDNSSADHVGVATISIGGPGNPDDSMSLAVDNATAAGVVVTVAAGNSGPSASTINSPGTARTAITVAAACKPDQIGVDARCSTPIASFSSRGPLIWNSVDMQKPDVAAPGVMICAARWASAFVGNPTCFDNNHVRISGTSMATPHVAGAAALLRQAYPQQTPAEIKQLLKTTASSLGFAYDNQGAGLVNLTAAIPLVSQVATSPTIWTVQSNPTAKLSTVSKDFVLTPLTTLGVLDISFYVNAPGITASFDKTQIDFTNNSSENLSASVVIDNDVALAGSYAASIALKQNDVTVGIIPVIISVQPTVTINPALSIDYGVDDPSLATWISNNQNITITNHRNDIVQTVNIAPTVFPNGIVLVVPPSVQVPAGNSVVVATHFEVDNSQVANKIYNGAVSFTNQTNSLLIPARFTKFYILTIQDSNATALQNATIWIHNRQNFSVLSTANTSPYVVYLDTAGPYDVVTRYLPVVANGQSTMATVYKEGITMAGGVATVNVSRSEALYTVKNNGVDSTGASVPAQHVHFFHDHYLPANFGYTFAMSNSSNDLSLNTFSAVSADYYHDDIYQIDPQPTNVLHIFYDKFQGLSSNQTFTNASEDFQMLKVQNDINRSSGTAQPVIHTCAPPPAGAACMNVVTTANTLSVPVTQTVYSLMPTGSYLYQQSDRLRTGCPASGPCSSIFYTPYFDVRSKNRYFFTPNELKSVAGDTIYNGLGPVFWNVKLVKFGAQTFLLRPYVSSINSAFLRQDFSLGEYSQFNYSLNQAGNTISSGVFPTYIQSGISTGISFPTLSLPTAGVYELAVANFPYQINGQTMNASVKQKFDSNLADPIPPTIKYLYHYTNNIRSEIHDSAQSNRLEFELDPMGGSLGAVTVEISTDGQNFASVPVTNANGIYSVTLPAVSGLKLTTRLTARDASGNELVYAFEMPAINPVSDTTLPVTSISSPVGGAIVNGVVNVQALATDNTAITKVELYVDNVFKTSTPNIPYVLVWDTSALGNGNHVLKTKAYDLAGNTGVSADVTVVVTNDAIAPTVSITSPANNVSVSGNVNITANATDNVGVARVEFYRDGVLLGNDTSAPFTFTWNTGSETIGAHALTAKAFDAVGNNTLSAAVNVTVLDQVPPTVSLTSPANGAVLSGTITVSAAANDNVGVNKVDFYRDNGVLVATDVATPYSVNLNTVNLTVGAHTLYAIATDAANNQTTSTPVNVTVADQQAPVTNITSPLNNSNVNRNTNVTIQATATDNVAVNKVEFYVGGVLKCTDLTAPYTCVWLVPSPKNAQYQLQTKAYDAMNNLGVSAIVTVTGK